MGKYYCLNTEEKMKDAIRKKMLEVRNRLSDDEVYRLSENIFLKLRENNFFNNSTNIMVYLDFRNEVKTDLIINYCLKDGKKIYIPVCIPETREICISRIESLNELQSGHYGIREPIEEHIRLADSSLINLALIPGVVFDSSGNRIGFGAGYYDRFIKRLQPCTVKAALAYSFQVIDSVPSDDHDVPMDYIITEKGTINCRHDNGRR